MAALRGDDLPRSRTKETKDGLLQWALPGIGTLFGMALRPQRKEVLLC
jgi:hypothetical protein